MLTVTCFFRLNCLFKMCSFIYGCALSEPILGQYFELPKKHPPNRNLIYDKSHRQITDVRNYCVFILLWLNATFLSIKYMF